MSTNPYTLVFGKEPAQSISRKAQTEEIIEDFMSITPSLQAIMIAGVRGSGKTVFMNNVAKRISQEKNWIVVKLNPTRDMLTSLAAKLSSNNTLAEIFRTAEINLSFFGFGINITDITPITDIETAITKMLQSLKKHGKRVLVTIDEAAHTQKMREFASAYQIFLSDDLPIFLLTTGVYENIGKLQNDKVLTFLYRLPRIDLSPLNISSMATNYAHVLDVPMDTARKMAQSTKGYPFAFQVLGHFAYDAGEYSESVIQEARAYLQDYSYRKIWEDLSEKDRRFMYGIAASESGKLSDIRRVLGTETNELNQYRARMLGRKLIDGSSHGCYKFTLPFFKEFVLDNYYSD